MKKTFTATVSVTNYYTVRNKSCLHPWKPVWMWKAGNNARGEVISMRQRNRGLCRRWSKSSKAFQRAHELALRHPFWPSRKISTGFFPALLEKFPPNNPEVTGQWTWHCTGCSDETFWKYRTPSKRHPTNPQTKAEVEERRIHLSWKTKKKTLTPRQETWRENPQRLFHVNYLGLQGYKERGVNNARGETSKETILTRSQKQWHKYKHVKRIRTIFGIYL